MNTEEPPKGLCTNCNRAVDLDATVCPHCGAPLADPDSGSAKQSES